MLFPFYLLTLTLGGRLNYDFSPTPKDIHVLISRSCDYVILHGKKNFTDVTKDGEMDRLFWIVQVLPGQSQLSL